ncbi:hypothetical protein MGG_17193 [Pyricularia oryzae 70-15]|uniref:Uncharacterized protein n=3 Tax=Pyricularia oryzae TaxID=318829 RepID=G4N835_PYRO7|nr:uncharacterized protein MGG_17193 [Pyricularia oryzae 70-15]EHA50936.1 hypothetical protein MGG_17193 [Pyricularia oryzae 70-15]ELQ44210.1 hypothetical protein OOU_Y34scaffold00095g55 [Pyricularia oryzae Y34]
MNQCYWKPGVSHRKNQTDQNLASVSAFDACLMWGNFEEGSGPFGPPLRNSHQRTPGNILAGFRASVIPLQSTWAATAPTLFGLCSFRAGSR